MNCCTTIIKIVHFEVVQVILEILYYCFWPYVFQKLDNYKPRGKNVYKIMKKIFTYKVYTADVFSCSKCNCNHDKGLVWWTIFDLDPLYFVVFCRTF